jgi:hypothetical protein
MTTARSVHHGAARPELVDVNVDHDRCLSAVLRLNRYRAVSFLAVK